jgi:hypothetical protein
MMSARASWEGQRPTRAAADCFRRADALLLQVDVLLDSAASGWNTVEREGISISHPARFILVGSGEEYEWVRASHCAPREPRMSSLCLRYCMRA